VVISPTRGLATKTALLGMIHTDLIYDGIVVREGRAGAEREGVAVSAVPVCIRA
jgi:hypothetical protein